MTLVGVLHWILVHQCSLFVSCQDSANGGIGTRGHINYSGKSIITAQILFVNSPVPTLSQTVRNRKTPTQSEGALVACKPNMHGVLTLHGASQYGSHIHTASGFRGDPIRPELLTSPTITTLATVAPRAI